LIGLAKQVGEDAARGEKLGLSEDEVACYDALEVNDSAVKVLGDATLKTLPEELVFTVRRNTAIDWTVRENIRAHLRVLVKCILRKYGYPPDKQERATLTVLEQVGSAVGELGHGLNEPSSRNSLVPRPTQFHLRFGQRLGNACGQSQ